MMKGLGPGVGRKDEFAQTYSRLLNNIQYTTKLQIQYTAVCDVLHLPVKKAGPTEDYSTNLKCLGSLLIIMESYGVTFGIIWSYLFRTLCNDNSLACVPMIQQMIRHVTEFCLNIHLFQNPF